MQTQINQAALARVLTPPQNTVYGFSQGTITSNNTNTEYPTLLLIKLDDGRQFLCDILLASHRKQLQAMADDIEGLPLMFSHEGFSVDGLPINPEFIRLIVGGRDE